MDKTLLFVAHRIKSGPNESAVKHHNRTTRIEMSMRMMHMFVSITLLSLLHSDEVSDAALGVNNKQ